MITLIISGLLALILGFLVWFHVWWLPRQPADRYEDRAQSDRDVQRIKDSMRGTL